MTRLEKHMTGQLKPDGTVSKSKAAVPIYHDHLYTGYIMFKGKNPYILKLSDFGLSEIMID